MADVQKQINKIEAVLDLLLEFHVLRTVTDGEVIPRQHSEFLSGDVGDDPIIEDNLTLSLKLNAIESELHEVAHTIFDDDGEDLTSNTEELVYTLGFDNAFS